MTVTSCVRGKNRSRSGCSLTNTKQLCAPTCGETHQRFYFRHCVLITWACNETEEEFRSCTGGLTTHIFVKILSWKDPYWNTSRTVYFNCDAIELFWDVFLVGFSVRSSFWFHYFHRGLICVFSLLIICFLKKKQNNYKCCCTVITLSENRRFTIQHTVQTAQWLQNKLE